MGLWVRNDIRLNMLRSTVISKDVRPAARTTRRSQSVRFCAKLQVMRGGRTNGRAVTLTVRPEILSFHRRRLERKIDEKSLENQRKSSPKRRKIDENSILGGFGRSKLFQARSGTRSGRVRDGQKPLLERSWAARDAPRAAEDGPKALPGESRASPRPSRSDVRAR